MVGATSAWPADWNCFYTPDSDWLTLGTVNASLATHTHTHTDKYRYSCTGLCKQTEREKDKTGIKLMDRQTDKRTKQTFVYLPYHTPRCTLSGKDALNNWCIAWLFVLALKSQIANFIKIASGECKQQNMNSKQQLILLLFIDFQPTFPFSNCSTAVMAAKQLRFSLVRSLSIRLVAPHDLWLADNYTLTLTSIECWHRHTLPHTSLTRNVALSYVFSHNCSQTAAAHTENRKWLKLLSTTWGYRKSSFLKCKLK